MRCLYIRQSGSPWPRRDRVCVCVCAFLSLLFYFSGGGLAFCRRGGAERRRVVVCGFNVAVAAQPSLRRTTHTHSLKEYKSTPKLHERQGGRCGRGAAEPSALRHPAAACAGAGLPAAAAETPRPGAPPQPDPASATAAAPRNCSGPPQLLRAPPIALDPRADPPHRTRAPQPAGAPRSLSRTPQPAPTRPRRSAGAARVPFASSLLAAPERNCPRSPGADWHKVPAAP